MKKYFNHHIKKAIVVQSLITIESLELSSTFSYPREVHEFYEFAYIDSGNLSCNLDDETIELSQGDFLLIPPKKSHFYLRKLAELKKSMKKDIELYSALLKTKVFLQKTKKLNGNVKTADSL